MNIVLSPHPKWTPEDQALAEQFMATPTWGKMIDMVMVARPSTKGNNMEERGIYGIQRETMEDTVNAFAQIHTFRQRPAEDTIQQIRIPETLTSKPYAQGR